jgi:hypothetical protein
LHTCFALTFLLANFSHFSHPFQNQRKILDLYDSHIQILWRKGFEVIWALFQTLKPNSQDIAKNFEICMLQKCFRIFSYTLFCESPNVFFIKSLDRCTLTYSPLTDSTCLPLKVLTNEKRGGLKVIAFDKSPFKLFTLKFSNKSVQSSSCERPKTAQQTLFILIANKKCFPITLLCRKLMKKTGKLALHVVHSNNPIYSLPAL